MEFLLAFHSNYGHIAYHFRDKARYWSIIAIFYTQPELDAPVGDSRRNIAITFNGKNYNDGLLDGENSLRICLLLPIQYTNVTNRQTDRQTNTA